MVDVCVPCIWSHPTPPQDPTRVQPHLKKCFDAIKTVTFTEANEIVSMESREKESVKFSEPVKTRGASVEEWMNGLESAMKASVRRVFYDAVQDYTVASRTDWMQTWPGQHVLNCSQVHWTTEIEAAIRDEGTAGVEKNFKKQLKQLEDMARGRFSRSLSLSLSLSLFFPSLPDDFLLFRGFETLE